MPRSRGSQPRTTVTIERTAANRERYLRLCPMRAFDAVTTCRVGPPDPHRPHRSAVVHRSIDAPRRGVAWPVQSGCVDGGFANDPLDNLGHPSAADSPFQAATPAGRAIGADVTHQTSLRYPVPNPTTRPQGHTAQDFASLIPPLKRRVQTAQHPQRVPLARRAMR